LIAGDDALIYKFIAQGEPKLHCFPKMNKAAAATLESKLRDLSFKLLNFFSPLATEIYKKVCPEDALAREPYIARAHLLSLFYYCSFISFSLRIH
jgi:hypothetical protein